jgi:acyl-CoA thioesterase I
MLAVKVFDHGIGGTTAAQGLEALPRTLALRPQAVLIEFGGHDYLRDRGRAATRDALDAMIRACREAGAEVILFEVPRGFLYDGFAGLERQLSREHDLELISDGAIRSLVLRSPWFPVRLGEPLSDDGLHPNAAGNVHLARAAAAALERVYGPAALRR